jgi:hypothetical protein
MEFFIMSTSFVNFAVQVSFETYVYEEDDNTSFLNNTLSSHELNTLSKIILKSNIECYICLDKLCKGSCVRQLKCQHCFCINCIDEWLLTYNNTCPICKTSQSG